MQSAPMSAMVEGNFDAASIYSGVVLTTLVRLMVAGTQDKKACFDLCGKWLEGSSTDRRNALQAVQAGLPRPAEGGPGCGDVGPLRVVEVCVCAARVADLAVLLVLRLLPFFRWLSLALKKTPKWPAEVLNAAGGAAWSKNEVLAATRQAHGRAVGDAGLGALG
jgi:hypothetical protein